MIVSADGYYNLTWTKITEYIESTVHNSNYQEKYFDGVETEIALFPETSIAIHLLAGAGGPEAAYVIVQGCYFNGQTRLQCLEQPHPPKGLLGEVIDRYDYPYFTPIPAARDTTFTRPGIGDLSIQMEVRYLDQDHKLIKTQSAGDFLTPRNTETNIAIQLE